MVCIIIYNSIGGNYEVKVKAKEIELGIEPPEINSNKFGGTCSVSKCENR